MEARATQTSSDEAAAIDYVVIHSAVYREHVHLVRTDEGWKIVNALWHFT